MKVYSKLSGIFILLFLFTTVHAIDHPDSAKPDSEFEEKEKPYLASIKNINNGTRDTIRAYHAYKIFLDEELNKTYKLLISKLLPEQQNELKASQRQWIKYRDAEFKLINNNWSRLNFGSSFAISRGDYSSRIIKSRLMQLFSYLRNYK